MTGRPTLRPVRTGTLLAGILLLAAGCGDAPSPTEAHADPCAAPALPLALGGTATGTLDAAADCLGQDARLLDRFLLELPEATLFTVSLTTRGYRPFMPLHDASDTVQVSGWASATDSSLTREHLFPAGSYLLHASSFGRAEGGSGAPQGSYLLSTARAGLPQDGCGRETSVTYGSVARGRFTADDCEATPDPDDPVLRRGDGYDLLLRPGVPVEVAATADVPLRLSLWANGGPVDVLPDLDPGTVHRITAGGTGFVTVYLFAEEATAIPGAYTLTFSRAGEPAGTAVHGALPPPPSADIMAQPGVLDVRGPGPRGRRTHVGGQHDEGAGVRGVGHLQHHPPHQSGGAPGPP